MSTSTPVRSLVSLPPDKDLTWLLILVTTIVTACSNSPGSKSNPAREQARLETERKNVDRQAVKHLLNAQQHFDHQAYRRALASVDTALAVDSSFTDAIFMKGQILSRLGRYETGSSYYKRVLHKYNTYKGVHYNLGNNAFRDGKYKVAVDHYQRELTHHPLPRAYTNLARSYHRLGKTDSALWALRHSIRRDSTNPAAYMLYARLMTQTGNVDSALHYGRSGYEHAPENLHYQYLLGSFYRQAGRFDSAVVLLKPVVEEQPTHRGANFNLGQALLKLGHKEEAQRYLDRIDSLQRSPRRSSN